MPVSLVKCQKPRDKRLSEIDNQPKNSFLADIDDERIQQMYSWWPEELQMGQKVCVPKGSSQKLSEEDREKGLK